MKQAINVARYILTKENPEIGEVITNLKLQKLLYYCQGFSLAINEKKLFSEKIYAWQHGPVVQEVYYEYKNNGSKPILNKSQASDTDALSPAEKELVDNVYNVYGQFSAWKLREMTHNEDPWKDTPINGVIEDSLLKKFFLTLVK